MESESFRSAQGLTRWPWRMFGSQISDAPSIRATLALLVVVCILPVAVVAALLFVSYYEREQLQLATNAVNRAKGFILAVDREFAATESALLALGTSHRLATGDLEGFHHRAMEALPNLRADSILVLDRNGQILLSTHRPFGDPLPKVADPKLLKRILETGRPGVSDLFPGPITHQRIFTVGVPVKIDDSVRYSLNATFTHQQFMALLKAQAFPPTWRVSITDSTVSIVARSHEVDKFLGKPVSPGLRARMLTSDEGSLESVTLDGVPVLTAYSRSPVSRWGVAVGIPKDELTAGLRHTLTGLVLATVGALGLGLWLAKFVGGWVARSITALTQPAMDLVSGAPLDIPLLHFKEANAMREALLQASSSLQKSQYDAHHDSLTGLPNRTLFHHTIAQNLALCERNREDLCVLFLDLDGFKAVNDTLGHAAGDLLLRQVSERIASACRASDICARLGGDEFAVALIHSDLEASRLFATRLVESISRPYVLGEHRVQVSVSIGVSHFPGHATDVDTLLNKADHAMYRAKAAGKGRVCTALERWDGPESGR
ncbi:MAG TPA: sensor domain-containing diguanylate cyclase [Acidovorax sp.]|nr:sensor domain-containing diguanylate cyclase [Acidovorax sp.]